MRAKLGCQMVLERDIRSHKELSLWLLERGHEPVTFENLAGDVSPRRYIRVTLSEGSAIVALYPPTLDEAYQGFLRSTRLLQEAGVRVPEILDQDDEAGLMMLEDVGADTLFDWRGEPWETVEHFVEASRRAATRIARISCDATDLPAPPLDGAALWRELEGTWQGFLLPTGLCGREPLRGRLHQGLHDLCLQLDENALVPCHRDFMVRNLVPDAKRRSVIVLDHQDLRLGPPLYDLASLSNDSLFLHDAKARDLFGGDLVSSLQYRRCAAQRTLKIVGTFVSFARRGQPRYLPMVGECLHRCLLHLAGLPETEGLVSDLRQLWGPTIQTGAVW